MLLGPALRPSLRTTTARLRPCLSSYSTDTERRRRRQASDPLRVLFCGSDEFSRAALIKLHQYYKDSPTHIHSIHVLTRPRKPTGRGFMGLGGAPVQEVAAKLKLPIHITDTFQGWELPKLGRNPINLIIAVSFGLFVPPRLIDAAKYGGLNVHPSFLPDLRGPAPLHHALLAEDTHTGVTVQTLSGSSFDSGTPLLQTRRPGVPIPPRCTFKQLRDLLAEEAGALLVLALRWGLHTLPYTTPQGLHKLPYTARQSGLSISLDDTSEPLPPPPPPPLLLRHAPKITPADRQIRWTTSTAHEVAVRARALGPLWTHIRARRGGGGVGEGEKLKRVILDNMSARSAPYPELGSQESPGGEGGDGGAQQGRVVWIEEDGSGGVGGGVAGQGEEAVAMRYLADKDTRAALLCMPDGSWLRVGKMKVAGSTSKPAMTVLGSLASK